MRTVWLADRRRENTAEHSWRLALFAGIFAEEFPELDLRKVLMMCLIHDIGELYDGDVSAALNPDWQEKYITEYKAASKVFALLPPKQANRLLELWKELRSKIDADTQPHICRESK